MRLTLDQYARVSQALALHRAAPDAVFSAEQITPEQWEKLKEPLELRVADAEPEAPLLEELSEASRRALLALRRKVAPLDEDPSAWFGFLKAYSLSPDPPAFLAQLGLWEVDVMTLHQFWSQRLESLDPAVRDHAVNAPPGVPSLRVEAASYPIPTDPIGPLNAGLGAEPEAAEDLLPVFGALPEED